MGLFRVFVSVTWVAVTCLASPMPMGLSVVEDGKMDLLVKNGIELAQSRGLDKRLSADFSMDKTWDNEVLFGGSWSDTQDDSAEKTALSITCLECYTRGTVTAKLWEDLFHPSVRLEFNQVEAYIFLGVETDAGGTYSINLFASQSPIGLGFPGLSVGVVFYVDLVFSLSAQINLFGGFYVKLADDAYLETDIFGGDITDSFFDGISSKSIPVTVQSGSATFKADLRLRVQCGAEASLDIIGIGSGAVVGIYANIIEFVAVIDSTPDCALETKEWWDLNAGAYAHLDVVVDYTTIGPVPTVSTTLLTAPTMTQCLVKAVASTILTASAASAAAIVGTTVWESSLSYSSDSSVTIHTSPSQQESSSAFTPTPVDTITSASDQVSGPTTHLRDSSSSIFLDIPSSRYPMYNSSVTAASQTASDDGALVTSTIYSTNVYTLTSCAASVVNCPASYQKEVVVTQTVDAFITVCPASAQITTLPGKYPSTTMSHLVPTAVYVVTEQVVILTPCATPVINTFVPPSQTAPFVTAGIATHKAVVATKGSNHSVTNIIWSNSTSATMGLTSLSQTTGSLTNLSTHSPMTAAAESPPRSLALIVAGLFFSFAILI